MKVYIIVGIKGEYSDRSEWINGVYFDKAVAIETHALKLRQAKEYSVKIDEYSKRRNNLIWNAPDFRYSQFEPYLYTTYEEFNKKVEEKLGPEPDGESADDYTIFECETDVWAIAEEVTNVITENKE